MVLKHVPDFGDTPILLFVLGSDIGSTMLDTLVFTS